MIKRRLGTGVAASRGAAPPKTVERTGKGFVHASVSEKRTVYHEEEEQHAVGSPKRFSPERPPAYVRISAGLTLNLGNFESLRIDCAVELPCLPEDLESAYEEASDFVQEKIAQEEEKWVGVSGKSSGKGR